MTTTRAWPLAGALSRWLPPIRRASRAWAPIVVAVMLLAESAISRVLAKVGHAGATLDDAYIHFQYARAIAEGHPLRYQAGAPITSGATSLLWPAALAPFWWLGARGEAIVWVAWALSFAALGGLAWEAGRWTERLAGRAAAVSAGAMVLVFGGFVWSAASGMEVVPFAWVIARAARRSSEWAEAAETTRGGPHAAELAVLACASALGRPEGVVTALFVATTLACFPTPRRAVGASAAAVSLAGAAGPFLLLAALTGSFRSNTAVVKLLPGNPYYAGAALEAAVRQNVDLFAHTLLNGEIWSAEFLPRGGAVVAFAGLVSVAWRGARTRSTWRALSVLLVAATMAAPCFYLTFLWNRLRYLWPFATAWLVGLACLTRVVGDAAAVLRPRWRLATPLLGGLFVGLFASKLDGVLDDVAASASGIDRQQVALGRWADQNLPADARVGVNDTGAIAYFGNRRTFDVVGLTTPDEGRYWVAGPGSRLEHYERLHATAPERLPTHFIVYPEWMAIDCLLGRPLREATVTDATILGGRTMRAYVADWSALGTGERPWTPLAGDIVDEVDVADLESEAAHGYELLGARDGDDVVGDGWSPAGARVVDGGRRRRWRDHFTAHLRPGAPARGVVRFESAEADTVRVFAAGHAVAEFRTSPDASWVERAFDVPATVAGAETPIELRVDGGTVTTYHYWFAQ